MRTYTNVFDLGDLKTALAEAFEIKNAVINMKRWASIRLVCLFSLITVCVRV